MEPAMVDSGSKMKKKWIVFFMLIICHDKNISQKLTPRSSKISLPGYPSGGL